MRLVSVIRHELMALGMNPYAYVVASGFFIISGVFFVAFFLSTQLPDLERYFSNVGATLVVLAPLVAARSFADERRSGVLDLQLSWPVPRWKLAVGKYVANTLYLGALVSVMWLYVRLLAELADIEAGKSVAEYVGLLLLVSAFSGIAHAISARSTTTPGAAFVGFGVLLALWTLDIIPGWLGNARLAGFRLSSLAPTLRLDAFGRGVIPLGDSVFFLGLALGAVVVSILSIGDRAPRWSRRRDVLHTRPATVMGLAGMLLFLLVPASDRLAPQWDLTPTARFSVSEATATQLIPHLTTPPRVTAFVERGSAMEVQLRALLAAYRSAGVELDSVFIDPDIQPSLARRFDVQRYGQAVIELDGGREHVESLTEVTLTSALLRLLRAEAPNACFTTGHGERSISEGRRGGVSQYAADLRASGFEVETIALGAPGGSELLATCDVVILAGPRVELLDSEVKLLANFVESAGRLVVLSGPEGTARQQLNGILRPHGVVFGEGVIADTSSLVDDPGSVVAYDYPSLSPATSHVRSHGLPTIFPATRPVAIDPAASGSGHATSLVRSSPDSFTDTGGSGPFDLAALADRSTVVGDADELSIERTRIAAVGSVDVATNEFFRKLGNRDFMLRLTEWVTRQDDLIAAAVAPGGVREVPVTAAQRRSLILRGIILPGLVPLPLAYASARRRRRG